MAESNNKNLNISIIVLGSIIAISAIVISLLTLFNVFNNEESNEDTLCPPNMCNITASTVTTPMFSSTNLTTNEIFNLQIIKSTSGDVNSMITEENLEIQNILNPISFSEGIKSNIKIEDYNIKYNNVSIFTKQISATNITSSNIKIDKDFIINNINTKKIDFTNATISNLSCSNLLSKNLSCSILSCTNLTLSIFSLNKENLTLPNITCSNIEANTISITNMRFLNTLDNSKNQYSTKITTVDQEIKVLENVTFSSQKLSSTNATISNLSVTQTIQCNKMIVSKNSNIIELEKNLNLNIKGKNANFVNVSTNNIKFQNINLNGKFIVENDLILKNLSTSKQNINEIIFNTLNVRNTSSSTFRCNVLKNIYTVPKIINSTISQEQNNITIYLIQSTNTIKTAINDSNTLIPYVSNYYINSIINEADSKVTIYFKVPFNEDINYDLLIGTSFKVYFYSKNIKTNLVFQFINEINTQVKLMCTEYIFNPVDATNNRRTRICPKPTVSNGKLIPGPATSITYYKQGIFETINNYISFRCVYFDANSLYYSIESNF